MRHETTAAQSQRSHLQYGPYLLYELDVEAITLAADVPLEDRIYPRTAFIGMYEILPGEWITPSLILRASVSGTDIVFFTTFNQSFNITFADNAAAVAALLLYTDTLTDGSPIVVVPDNGILVRLDNGPDMHWPAPLGMSDQEFFDELARAVSQTGHLVVISGFPP